MKNYFLSILLVALLIVFSIDLKAQDLNSSSLLVFIPKLEIGLIQGIGLGFEIPVSQKSIIEFGTGLGSGYTIYSENKFANTWDIANPAFYAQAKYKNYYNRQKRLDKGKSVLNNSGNYVGLRFKYASRQMNPTYIYNGISFFAEEAHKVTLFDVHWGFKDLWENAFYLILI